MQAVPGNQIFSPASIAVALEMTYAGARGETAAQMGGVLGVEEADALHEAAGNVLASWNDPSRSAYTLRVANRLFGERRFMFRQPFVDLTASMYSAPLEALDFVTNADRSRVHINEWVARQTNDRIRDLIPPGSIDGLTRLVLANAVYFLARWERPFEPNDTDRRPFFVAANRSVQAPTMQQSESFRYAEVPGAQVLEMPYRGGEIAMTIVLPTERMGLAAIERELDADRLAKWIAALGKERVAVSLPKFRVEPGSISMTDHLRALGMPLAFDPQRADFDGMAPRDASQDALYVSDVFHKAFVEVDEDGTQAAAASAVVMTMRSASMFARHSVVFNADHPFLFLIRDTRSGAILFMGRLVDPS